MRQRSPSLFELFFKTLDPVGLVFCWSFSVVTSPPRPPPPTSYSLGIEACKPRIDDRHFKTKDIPIPFRLYPTVRFWSSKAAAAKATKGTKSLIARPTQAKSNPTSVRFLNYTAHQNSSHHCITQKETEQKVVGSA